MALGCASSVLGGPLAAGSAFVGRIDSAYASLADLIGAPVDYVKLFSLLLASLPLAAPLPYLPAPVKHMASIVVSSFFMGPVLHIWSGFLQLLFSASVTYALVAFNVGGRRMPWVVFAFQMGHLTIKLVLSIFVYRRASY